MPDMDSARGVLSDDAFDALVSALAEGGARPEDLDEALHARGVTSLTPRERADLRDTLRVIEALRADPDTLVVDHAGEVLHRLSHNCDHS